jgi:cytidylate kinase
MQREVITVDGLAASGKTALAKLLALRLGYGHLNSGLLYRAVGYLTLTEGKDPRSCQDVLDVVSRHRIELSKDATGSSVAVLDGAARDAELAAPEVTEAASLVARHQPLRDLLLPLQQDAFLPGGIVAEGRDMGTVVFPKARLKFFVTADVAVRAERRFAQLKGTPQAASLESIRKGLEERDHRDLTSEVGTTKQAEGAILVRNDQRSLDETVEEMYQRVLSEAPLSLHSR